MTAVLTILLPLVVVAGTILAARFLRPQEAEQVAAALTEAADEAALQFKSRVGLSSPFFAPRTGDVAPTASVSGPMGLGLPIPVVACSDHPDFGARWQLCVPPFAAAGNYRINVSSGEVYDIAVKE